MDNKDKPQNEKVEVKNQPKSSHEDDYEFFLKSKMDHFSAVPENEKEK